MEFFMKSIDFNGYFKELEREISDLKYELGELKEELQLVKKIKQAPKQKLFSTKDAALFLNINPQTVRNYVNLGKLGCLKGYKMRALKFKQEHLDDFIKNQMHYKKSDSQLKMEVVTAHYTNPKLQTNWK
jgi:DNA-binding transcriptional regulator YhcF (GntR family)